MPSQIALPLGAIVYLWPDYREFHAETSPKASAWLIGSVVGVLVFLIWIRLDFDPWVMGSPEGFDPRNASGRIQPSLTAVRLFGAALVVPVMEELFWRSFIMRWLQSPGFLGVEPRTVGTMPLLVSSALFATEHNLWLAGLIAGLAYGWLYRWSGNVWIPVLSHGLTNALLGAWVLATGSWSFW